MIKYYEESKTFHFTTPNTSYVFRIFGERVMEHLYYGKRLQDLEGMFPCDYGKFVSGAPIDSEFSEAESFVSTDIMLQEYSFYGSCDLRTPGFHAAYADGSRITKMKYVSHEIYQGKPKLKGLPAVYVEEKDEAETLEVIMEDELTGLRIRYRYSAFQKLDVITRNIEVENTGKKPVNIEKIMSCCLDFETSDYELLHLHGAWGRESYVERCPLMNGCIKIESRRGASAHTHRPFVALVRKETTENSGEVYGFNLLYSGNFEAGAEVERYLSTRVFLGINSFDFHWLLNPGEEFVAPEVVMTYTDAGIGEMSRTYHELYRTRLARGKWRDLERPVLINNWEATYFDFNEEKILDIAKRAKKAGIEMLVLDDGWFGKRDNDRSSLGDWYADLRKLPNGVKGLAEKIHKEGLQFGLWVEPEMISPDSDLYRAHPDWCLHVNGRGRSCGRWQLVLDLAREDVKRYIIDVLSDILSESPIDYIKWDMNRNLSEIGSDVLPPERQAETAHRYMLGLYEILETLRERFPEVLFEGCAAGGGRFDAGMMYYFNQYWTSDNSDAGERMYIQHGTSYIMPPVFMGAHVSAVPNHQVGRVTSLETRGCVAMGGQLGYELDITKASDEELEEIKKQIELYKDIRQTVHWGNMYRLKSPFESNYAVWEYVSDDQNTVVILYNKIKAMVGFERNSLKLYGIPENSRYRLRGTEKVFKGEVLNRYGLCVEAMGVNGIDKMRDYSGRVLILDRVES